MLSLVFGTVALVTSVAAQTSSAFQYFANSLPNCPGPNADPGTVGVVGDGTPKSGTFGQCMQVNQGSKSLSVWDFEGPVRISLCDSSTCAPATCSFTTVVQPNANAAACAQNGNGGDLIYAKVEGVNAAPIKTTSSSSTNAVPTAYIPAGNVAAVVDTPPIVVAVPVAEATTSTPKGRVRPTYRYPGGHRAKMEKKRAVL